MGLLIAAAMAFLVFEPRAALANQTNRSRELGQQVVKLPEHVGSLEKEVRVTVSRRPVESANVIPPLETTPLITMEAFKPSIEHSGSATVVETLPITWAADWRAYQPAGIAPPPAPIVLERRSSDAALLKKLYFGYAALQVGDIITTTRALNRGAREANPLLSEGARSPARLIGVKAATTVAMILAIENLRKRHPVVGRITLIAINATLAAVTINNASAAYRAKRADQ